MDTQQPQQQPQQQHMAGEEEPYDLTPLLSRDGDVTAEWCTMPTKTTLPHYQQHQSRSEFPERRQSLVSLWAQPPTQLIPPPAPRPPQSSRFNPAVRPPRPQGPPASPQEQEHRLSTVSNTSAPSMMSDRFSSDSDASFDDGDYHARSAVNFDSFYQDGSPKPRRVPPPPHRRHGLPPFAPQPEDMAQLSALHQSAELAQSNACAIKRVACPKNIQILPLPEQQRHTRNTSSWPLVDTATYPVMPQQARAATSHASMPSYAPSTASTSSVPSFSTATTPNSSPLVSPATPNFAFNASATTLRNSGSTTASSNFIAPSTSQFEEKSAWDDSDDEDEEEDGTPFAAFRERLHIRSPSSDQKKGSRRSATAVLRGVFRKGTK